MAFLYGVNYLPASQLVVRGWGASGLRAGQERHHMIRRWAAGFVKRTRPGHGHARDCDRVPHIAGRSPAIKQVEAPACGGLLPVTSLLA